MRQQELDQPVLHKALARLSAASCSDEADEPLQVLAALAATGESRALRAIVAHLLEHRVIEHRVRNLLLNPSDVEDAVQRTLEICTTKIGGYSARGSFHGWIYRIARNEALQIIRARNAAPELAGGDLQQFDTGVIAWTSGFCSAETIAAAISQLTPEHQQVIKLREELHYSYTEIANHLNEEVGTIKSRISRARTNLRAILLDIDPDRRQRP